MTEHFAEISLHNEVGLHIPRLSLNSALHDLCSQPPPDSVCIAFKTLDHRILECSIQLPTATMDRLCDFLFYQIFANELILDCPTLRRIFAL
jgi:hypothetical protein